MSGNLFQVHLNILHCHNASFNINFLLLSGLIPQIYLHYNGFLMFANSRELKIKHLAFQIGFQQINFLSQSYCETFNLARCLNEKAVQSQSVVQRYPCQLTRQALLLCCLVRCLNVCVLQERIQMHFTSKHNCLRQKIKQCNHF